MVSRFQSHLLIHLFTVLESMADPSIFSLFIACSNLLTIFITSCQSSHVVMVVWGLLENLPIARLTWQRTETCNTATADVWNHALSQLGENLMNLKLLCLLFDSSLTVHQTDTCRGSSALLKFQSSFYFSAEVCLFSLLLHFNNDTVRRKIIDDLKLLYSFLNFPLADPQTDSCRESSAILKFDVCPVF